VPVSAEYHAYVLDLLAPLGAVEGRRMFGGAGVFYRGLMFALIADDVLYLKVDDATRPDFEAAGAGAFTYETSSGTRGLRSYFRVPDEILESEAELAAWGRRAVDAALRAEAGRPKRKRRSPQAGG
jgi:DNA transformation protein